MAQAIRFTFKHESSKGPVTMDFDFAGDPRDKDAKLDAAVSAWNAAHPDDATTVEKVTAGHWSIWLSPVQPSPDADTDADKKTSAPSVKYTFKHDTKDGIVAFEFDYTGDELNLTQKLAAAVQAWNEAYPDQATTPDEVRKHYWALYTGDKPAIF